MNSGFAIEAFVDKTILDAELRRIWRQHSPPEHLIADTPTLPPHPPTTGGFVLGTTSTPMWSSASFNTSRFP